MQTAAERPTTEPAKVRWCLGLPKVSERKLASDELEALRAFQRRTRLTRVSSLLVAGALLAAPLVYAVAVAPELLPDPQTLGLALLAYLGACLVVCGLAGTLWELCCPQRTWHRAFFAVALALSSLLAWFVSRRAHHVHEVLLLGMIAPLFGCAAFVERILKQSLLGQRLSKLDRDLVDGRVEIFRGASERLGSEREQVPEGLVQEAGRTTLEVLPHAGLPWSTPMASGSAIVLLHIRETALREELPETPLRDEVASEGVELGQRMLTMQERTELSRYARLLTRRAVIHGLVIFWFIALVVPTIVRLAVPDMHSRMSFVAGCIALVTGFTRGAAILQHRTKVERDAAEGLVVIVRPRSDEEIETEFLPHSEVEWTVARAVAPWRRKLQPKSAPT